MAYFEEVRTRFAPSPTGFMHVGNLRTALYSYLIARAMKGKFILRIEDTDQARFVEGAVDTIYKTMAAAGLHHDEGPDNGGAFGPYIQSERRSLYKKYALELVEKGAAYYCFCDKNEPENDDEDGTETHGGYDGRCRELKADEVAAALAAGKPYVIRQKIDREGVSTFTDLVFGEITIENKVLDDQILLKQDGMPTYNFANVVDDHLMKISHVVRGSEYLPSTPKYNMLYRAFGWEIPQYVHLPLIMGRNADGSVSKLSKRHGSVSFENLMNEGYLPEAVINYIALLGWSPKNDREIFSLAELEEIFSIAGLNKAPAVFDYTKLKWMNGEYTKVMDSGAFSSMAFAASGLSGTALEGKWPQIAALLQSRIGLVSEIPGKVAFLLNRPDFDSELFVNKKNKCDRETALNILTDFITAADSLPEWENDPLFALLQQTAAKYNMKSVMWAVRIALSGETVTVGGATDIMTIIGREESLKRLRSALEQLS